ncbi:MAG: hypothetical protein ACI9MC_003433 [Kiritimatiellia bacterium]|jgi:hypothetical protein
MSLRPLLLLPLIAGCLLARIEAGPSLPLTEDPRPVVAIEAQVSYTAVFYAAGIRARAKVSSDAQQLAFGPQFGLQIPFVGLSENLGFVGIMGGIHLVQFDRAPGISGASIGTPFLVPSFALPVHAVERESIMLTLSVPMEYNIRLHPDLRSRPMVGVLLGVQYVLWPKKPRFRR